MDVYTKPEAIGNIEFQLSTMDRRTGADDARILVDAVGLEPHSLQMAADYLCTNKEKPISEYVDSLLKLKPQTSLLV